MSSRSPQDHSDDIAVFADVVVVDLSEGMAGSLATMVLADYGANVVKVEPPQGDWTRNLPGFLMWNRGKRSMVVDPREPSDVECLRSLIARSDVVVISKGGWAQDAGIALSSLAGANPRLV